ncbi:MAG: fatty acid desaturase [Chitinophagales bacterium]|nr:fatty acid desaturase [Chitinophagales bacterium]MDW8392791.1 fatty acid desaturase [Chitinophagales bacterium]
MDAKPMTSKDQSTNIRFTPGWWGLVIALGILVIWAVVLFFLLSRPLTAFTWWLIPAILLQTHLYTGIFITAHDAMHGTVAPLRWLNDGVGWVAATLFAFNYWPRLYRNHHRHHRHVGTADDPDVHQGPFWKWYIFFLKQYITWPQVVLMALTYNGLSLLFQQVNVALFWMIPALLSTLQLFYFGTYLPHKGSFPKANRHHSDSLRKNHLWAFLSCYFFGYHYEHHELPHVPWWQLHRVKGTLSVPLKES